MTDPRTPGEALRKMAKDLLASAAGDREAAKVARVNTWDRYRQDGKSALETSEAASAAARPYERYAEALEYAADMVAEEAERLEALEAKAAELTEEDCAAMVRAIRFVSDASLLDELSMRDLVANLEAAGFTITRKVQP